MIPISDEVVSCNSKLFASSNCSVGLLVPIPTLPPVKTKLFKSKSTVLFSFKTPFEPYRPSAITEDGAQLFPFQERT